MKTLSWDFGNLLTLEKYQKLEKIIKDYETTPSENSENYLASKLEFEQFSHSLHAVFSDATAIRIAH